MLECVCQWLLFPQEGELRLTLMIQVLAKLLVAVTTGGYVKVTLNLVESETAKDTAGIVVTTLGHFWRSCKLLPLVSSAEIVVDILFLVVDASSFSGTASQLVGALDTVPVRPESRVAREGLTGHDTISRGILNVDVHVVALHGDDDVEVELQVVRDALFHAERVVSLAHVPSAHLGHCQQERGQGEKERPHSSILRLCRVGRFGFGCFNPSSVSLDNSQSQYNKRNIRKASNALTTEIPLDSPNAPSSRPESANPSIVVLS
jgi:hypothetical protein